MEKNKLFFPLFVDLSSRKILVVGGGTIAARRIESLLDFTEDICLLSPEAHPDLQRLAAQGRIRWIRQAYQAPGTNGTQEQVYGQEDSQNLVQKADLVLVCTDCPKTNEAIYRSCKQAGIPVNVCSDRDKCDFYFPGIARKNHLLVGITASGQSHQEARRLRERIQEVQDTGDF